MAAQFGVGGKEPPPGPTLTAAQLDARDEMNGVTPLAAIDRVAVTERAAPEWRPRVPTKHHDVDSSNEAEQSTDDEGAVKERLGGTVRREQEPHGR